MSVLEFFQRVIAFFLIIAAVAFAKPLTFPLSWVCWKIARFPFETSFNKHKIWIW